MIHLKPGIDFEKSAIEAPRDHGFICSDEPLEHPDPEIQKMLSEFRLFDPPLTNELYEKWLSEQEEERKKQEAKDKLPETVAALNAALADADALNLDQDYRLTLLELGVTDDETTA